MTRKKRREYERNYLKEKRYILNRKIRTYFKDIIRKGTKKSKYEKILGYTIKEFKDHIEKNFENWMDWENYGEWEIDHITPLRKLKYKSEKDKLFKIAWNLNNLRPLSKEKNMKRKK